MDDHDDVFVSLEGIDGTGKTGVAKRLETELRALGLDPLVTHDPPAIEPWRRFKSEILDKETEVSSPAEAMLYFSGRLDNVLRFIVPALEAGRVVVADRFTDSWIAYQTLKLEPFFGSREAATGWLRDFSQTFLEHGMYVAPGKTYLIVDTPEEAVQRAAEKGPTKWEKADFLAEVQRIYLRLAHAEPDRFEVFDIHNRAIDGAIDEIVEVAVEYIGQRVRV